MSVSERIKELREKNSLTQAQLARKLSITRSSVNAWELGISVPSTEKLRELTEVLHCSADYILGLSSSESISIERLNAEEKEIIYRLMHYFDTIHQNRD